MIRYLLFLPVLIFVSPASLSQTNTSSRKECRISSGYGFSNSIKNAKGTGSALYVQLSCDVVSNFSIATEFENMRYKHPGYSSTLPAGLNEITDYNNNFSLLIKYNFLTKKKLKVAAASGWMYCIIQREYFSHDNTGTSQSIHSNVETYADYRIPFLAEFAYPVARNLSVEARFKYSTNVQQENTYSGCLGLSLKL